MTNLLVTPEDFKEAARQLGYPPDITRDDIRYWDGGVKLAEVDQRAKDLARHRISHSLPGDGRFQKYLADETAARERLATFPDTVRQRLIKWQEGQSEWFSDTLLEIVAEFIAFDDASRAGEAENKAGGLWYRRWHTAQTRVNELEALLANPPKHKFWGAGDPDCPREIKAPNGELHTLRCKACGMDNPSDDICLDALAPHQGAGE